MVPNVKIQGSSSESNSMDNEIKNLPLKQIAEKIIDKIPNKDQDPEKFGSVIIILTIISIVLTLIRVWQECNKNKLLPLNKNQRTEYFGQDIKNVSIRRSWFTKMTIKKVVRQQLSKEDYKNYGVSLVNAVLDTATNLTQSEIKTLVEAANV